MTEHWHSTALDTPGRTNNLKNSPNLFPVSTSVLAEGPFPRPPLAARSDDVAKIHANGSFLSSGHRPFHMTGLGLQRIDGDWICWSVRLRMERRRRGHSIQ